MVWCSNIPKTKKTISALQNLGSCLGPEILGNQSKKENYNFLIKLGHIQHLLHTYIFLLIDKYFHKGYQYEIKFII